MNEKKVMNRWLAVLGAVLVQLCLGAIYAWSVFVPTLKDSGWSNSETQAVFAAGLASFAIVMVFAGRLMPKVGPRFLAMVGGLVLGIGYVLAGLIGPTHFLTMLICVGIIGGAGIGLAYVVPIAVGMRWFPDKKGLITGLAVAGFGFGATLWVKLAGSWGHLIENRGIGNTLIIYGIVFMVAVVIGGIWMVFPPVDFKPAGWTGETTNVANKNPTGVDFKSGEMLSTIQFYMIFLTFMIGAGSGLMSIGLMKSFPKETLQAGGLSLVEASAIAGTAMAVFFSIANGIGRILWGKISDIIGRKRAALIMMATQGIFLILFQWMAGSEYLLYLGATIIGFNFGGNFSIFPTITADTFGAKNIAQNYPWIFLSYGVGGIIGPMLGGKLGDLNNFPLAFTICGVCCLVAAILISCVKPPQKV